MEQKIIQQKTEQPKQQGINQTGIPTQRKLELERRSGLSFDDLRVYYNSEKPAKINALAYAEGTRVYMGPGQEGHLEHELQHVVQQKQGIVRQTTRINGLPVNDEPALETAAERGMIFPLKCMGRVENDPVVQRLPNVVDVAKQRLIDIYVSQVNPGFRPDGETRSEWFQAVMHDMFLPIKPQTRVNRKVDRQRCARSGIYRKLLICGVPILLSAQMATVNENRARTAFEQHYGAFDRQAGQDVGQVASGVTPSTIPPQRLNRLIILSGSLTKIALPVIQKAVDKGKDARQWGLSSEGAISEIQYTNRVTEFLFGSDLNEGTTRFNMLIAPYQRPGGNTIPQVPKAVMVGPYIAGGVTSTIIQPQLGLQQYGTAAGPSQVVHEHGHLLENNLGVNDFVNLHCFLRARTRLENDQPRTKNTGWGAYPTGGLGMMPSCRL